MLKKVLIGCGLLIIAVLIFTVIIPEMQTPKESLGDIQTKQAILAFANKQMEPKIFQIPQNALEWALEDITIHKITEIPGPHKRKEAIVTLTGYYLLPAKEFRQPKRKNFKFKGKFNYGHKYPNGISVQYIRR
nr:hypothetical protein [Candidatus Cloacimonadota bacterium]